ncbi:TonB-dependent receptor plug domain-containing protein [Seleniivibrio woodruffii]|uniref:TonB-dependent receptor plug domain-containing protein n=1 Tax=Seleniivibrio woodruffii TaxID=1078050 RepID=UPI00240970BB|nr:TonB-dependent receptor [Seleniivibrio woodruffii]
MTGKKLTAFLAAMLVSVSAYAADVQLKQNEVLVTATRSEKAVEEVPMTISVITSEDIAKSGSATLADLLRDIPGVQLSSTGSSGIFRLSIRGENASRTLVMIDGVKISEQKSMDGAPLLVDVASIERIEVIKGPASVLYGSEAIGGVVNVITKKGGTKPIQGSLSTIYDSGTSGTSTSLSLFGSLGGVYYRVDATDTAQGDRKDSDGDKVDYTKFDSTNYRGLVGYKNKNFDFGVEHTVYRSDNEVKTGMENVDPSVIGNTKMEMDLPEWNRDKTQAYFEFNNTNAVLSRFRLDVYHQNTFKEFINNMYMKMSPMMPVMSYLSRTKNDLDSVGFNAQTNLVFTETNLLILGAEYMKDDLEAKESIQNFGQTSATAYKSDANQSSMSFFVQDEQIIAGDFVLTGGLRYTRTETELESTNKGGQTPGSSETDSTVGSLSLTYKGFKDTVLRAQVATGYRTPNLQQLYMGTTHGSSTPTKSNKDLDSETSTNYELGVRYMAKGFDIDAAFFYSKAKDYITTQKTVDSTTASGFANVYTNINDATTKGLELALGYTVNGFRPYIEATLVSRDYEYATYKTEKVGLPERFARYGVEYSRAFGKNVLFNADLYMRYAQSADTEDATGAVTTDPGYSTYNLSLSGTYTFDSGRRLMLAAEALNLNNEDYYLAMATESLVEPGRHFVLKAGIEF